MAAALTSAEVAATLEALTIGDINNISGRAGALGELAPHLTAAQTRTALDALADPDGLEWDGCHRAGDTPRRLGAPDEALARVTGVADPCAAVPAQSARRFGPAPARTVATGSAGGHPAVREARERVAARTALLPHLPPGNAASVIAEAAALRYPEYEPALAQLVSAGHTEAEPLLTVALRDTCASGHLDGRAAGRADGRRR